MKVLIRVMLAIAALLMAYLDVKGLGTDSEFALLAISIAGICAGLVYRLR